MLKMAVAIFAMLLMPSAVALLTSPRRKQELKSPGNLAYNTYAAECFQKRPVGSPVMRKWYKASLAQTGKNPGAGIDEFEPFETVLKDGFMMTTCIKDKMFYQGDKFGPNKHDYTMGTSSNVSIVHYDDYVPKEDRHQMTQAICFEFCRTVPDMLFFGVVNGRDCYCTPYYVSMESDSTECDKTCEGEPTLMCGGKAKSSIFSMHFCDTTAKDLETASFEGTFMAGDIATRTDYAKSLSESMQEAAEKNQETFGKAGDPAASDLMQEAKSFAGVLEHAVDDTVGFADDLMDDVEAAGELKEFTKPEVVTKAERLMESIKTTLPEAKEASKMLGDLVSLAAPSKEYEGAAAQYYPIMYFVDKEYTEAMQTCSGDAVGKPIVGETLDGCSAACDAMASSEGCVGYSYFGTADDSLCFLFSNFKSAVYYTGCKDEDKKDALFLQTPPALRPPVLLQTSTVRRSKVAPWPCGGVGRPFQVLNGKKIRMMGLDISTGKYQFMFEIKKNWASPPINGVNGCQVNPKDSYLYCMMRLKGKKLFYLTRLDHSGVEFVAHLHKFWFAGTFDMDGVYYGYGQGATLHEIEDVSVMPGSADPKSAHDLRDNKGVKVKKGGDLAVIKADFEGTGIHKYLLAIGGLEFRVMRLHPEPAHTWTIKAKGLEGRGAWGAIWSFKNEFYFFANAGTGVFQLDLASVDLNAKTATFKKAADGSKAGGNDGFNCMNGKSPFPPVLPPAPLPPVGPKAEAPKPIPPEPKEETPQAEPEKAPEPKPTEPPAAPPVAPKRGQVMCMAKFSDFNGVTLKPDPSGKCKQCLKKLVHADRCY